MTRMPRDFLLPKTPRSYLAALLPDGRQVVEIHDLAISVPKHTDKYYHVRVALREGPSDVKGILHNRKRRLTIDGSAHIDSVTILFDQPDIPAITRDAILGVEVSGELSQAEFDAIAEGLRDLHGS